MDLEQLLSDIKPSLNEAKVPDDTEKFIKNIESLRLNMALKRVDNISSFMRSLASQTRGPVKDLILKGAKGAFEKSRKEASEFRKQFDDDVNKYVEKTVNLLNKSKNEVDAADKIDKNAPKFHNFFDSMTDNIVKKYEEFDDGLAKRSTISLNTDRLKTNEEKKYSEMAGMLVEYYVRELLKIRVVLSTFQVFLARVVKQVEYKDSVTQELPFIFKSFIRNKFGAVTGEYLVAHVDKYYTTTEHSKEEFAKFENLMNDLLGIK